ncbi:MAG TPA: DUF2092 domain-containing protein [Kofleriaceae bacterium]|nr:DUF2092 domain-containing protein [Kofleriaceae bacterium]
MKRTKLLGAAASIGLLAAVMAYADDPTPTQPPPKPKPAAKPEAKPEATDDAKQEPQRTIDPKADDLLKKMSRDLAKLESFSVDAEHVTEVVTTDKQKLQVLASSTVIVHRPDNLRSDRKSALGAVTLYYDGTNLTVFGRKNHLYATTGAPNTLDKMIDFARDELDLDAPAADLLYSDVYAGLMENVVSGMYVDEAIMGNRTCKHLAYRGKETDFEIWIEDGKRALPCRFVITTKDVQGWPQYEVELTNWKVLPPVSKGEFTFHPHKEDHTINFISVAKAQKKQGFARRTTRRTTRRTEDATGATQPTVVKTLPEGCTKSIGADGAVQYTCGSTRYAPSFDGPNVVYEQVR